MTPIDHLRDIARRAKLLADEARAIECEGDDAELRDDIAEALEMPARDVEVYDRHTQGQPFGTSE